jgi:hypothetical protein
MDLSGPGIDVKLKERKKEEIQHKSSIVFQKYIQHNIAACSYGRTSVFCQSSTELTSYTQHTLNNIIPQLFGYA